MEKITAKDEKPLSGPDKESLTNRICRGLDQVKLIREGKLPKKSIEDMLNDL